MTGQEYSKTREVGSQSLRAVSEMKNVGRIPNSEVVRIDNKASGHGMGTSRIFREVQVAVEMPAIGFWLTINEEAKLNGPG